MIRNKKILYILAASLVLFGTACKKFLDVNQNVNDPVAVPTSTLLSTAELNLGNNLSYGGLSGHLAVYMHQMSTRETANQYGVRGATLDGIWGGFFDQTLPDLDVIIKQATTEDNMIYAGIAKILKAYTYSQIVDVWGDVPYTDFNKFKEGVKQPAFDDDATIYPKLLAMLDEGIADIQNTTAKNPSKPAGTDVIYKGNTANWIKAANTIKLKLYTQIRKVQNVSTEVNALLAAPATLINSNAESFLLPYGPLGATDDRNPGFGDYTATQRSNHVSPWFYEILKGYNQNIFTGIADPRTKYYIYNQLTPAAAAQSNTEYRDGAFVSIYFGSTGPYRDGNQQNSISVFGIYPVGGRYDAGTGGVAGANSGTGAAPYRFITYADRLFLEAELINAGVATGDARTVFNNALKASMSQIDYVITTYVKTTQTVPVLATSAAATTYINDIMALYDAATTERQLEYIITEKWLSSVGSSVDQYADYRRTGYPILFDPGDPLMAPGGKVQPPVDGNPFVNPQLEVPVARGVNFPQSLPWSQSELDLNGNAPDQKQPDIYKIFWKP
ncbi:MAG: SusD/RagB family nutrient-binding outer membrane lipoprotein [Chitinophagaceae bacterium]|nr:SusD/RagB family nutrient-binding outer membrane lipoprotein [Chitinophagaceae bacterium]